LKGVIDFLSEELYSETIVLFGSLSKLETRKDSDIDLAVFGKIKKEINLIKFEKTLKRKIQVFKFDSLRKVNKELRANILNGVLMKGGLK
jgi:predicted nucleotidyltransferase